MLKTKLRYWLPLVALLALSACGNDDDDANPDGGTPASGGLWDNLSGDNEAYVVCEGVLDATFTTSIVSFSVTENLTFGGNTYDFNLVRMRSEDGAIILDLRFYLEDGRPTAATYTFSEADINIAPNFIIPRAIFADPALAEYDRYTPTASATFNVVYANNGEYDIEFDVDDIIGAANLPENQTPLSYSGVVRVR